MKYQDLKNSSEFSSNSRSNSNFKYTQEKYQYERRVTPKQHNRQKQRGYVMQTDLSSKRLQQPSRGQTKSKSPIYQNQQLQIDENKDMWMPDSKSKHCSNPQCYKEFGFFQRKHHCRLCLRVFCNNCTIKTNKQNISDNQRQAIIQSQLRDKKPIKQEENSKKILDWQLFEVKNENKNTHVKICIGCKNDNDMFNNFKKNHYNQQIVNHIWEKNKLEMNSEDQMSMFSSEKDTQKYRGETELQRVHSDSEHNSQEEEQDDENEMLDFYVNHNPNTFIDSDGLQESRITENQARQKRLKELSKEHIYKVVRQELIRGKIDIDQWSTYLKKFVLQAVDSVKPSSRYLKDDMDFNKYVNIELLDYKDNTKSQYVNGCVLMKNLADRRMPHELDNPKILLLQGSLGFMREYEDQSMYSPQQNQRNVQQELYVDITSAIDQEDFYVQILEEKIKQISPNLIITEKYISFKVLDVLRKNKIAAITNLHIEKMKKIARLTKTIIAPSANVVDKNFQLGQCQKFRVENSQNSYSIGGFSNIRSSGIFSKTPKSYVETSMLNFEAQQQEQQSQQIIYIEGCNPILGCTIVLSSPFKQKNIDNFYTGLEMLQKIQKLLRKMLHISRNIILEREFLNHLKINPIQDYSPFLVKGPIKNRRTLVLSKIMIKKGQQTLKNEQQQLDYSLENQEQKKKKKKILNNVFQQQSNDSYSFQVSSDHPSQQKIPLEKKVDEHFVKTKFDSMCGQPQKIKFQFYNINVNSYENGTEPIDMHRFEKDETIGSFLVRLAQQSDKQNEKQNDDKSERKVHSLFCKEKNCKDNLNKHILSFYHRDGCLDVQINSQKKNEVKIVKQKSESKVLQFADETPFFSDGTYQKKQSQIYFHGQSFVIEKKNPLNYVQRQRKMVKNWHKIYMTSECKLCGYVLNDKQLMSDTLFEYSLSRFIEQYFYNQNLSAFNTNKMCGHCPLRDYKKVFLMEDGSTISFMFTKKDVYSIELLNAKKQRGNNKEVINLFIKSQKILEDYIQEKSDCFDAKYKAIIETNEMNLKLYQKIEEKFKFKPKESEKKKILTPLKLVGKAKKKKVFKPKTSQHTVSDRSLSYPSDPKSQIGLTTLESKMRDRITQRKGSIGTLQINQIQKDYLYHLGLTKIVEKTENQPIVIFDTDLNEESTPTPKLDENEKQDDLIIKLIDHKDLIISQVEKIQKSYKSFLKKVQKSIEEILEQLENPPLEHDKHFCPLDLQKLYFIERKFTVNNLSYESVLNQHLKILCIVLTLIEQKCLVLKLSDTLNIFDYSTVLPYLKTNNKVLQVKKLKSNPNLVSQLGDIAAKDNVSISNSLLGAAANFFLLKSKPPNISLLQMQEFLRTFFGNDQNKDIQCFFEKSTDQEIKDLYNQGYKQINENVRNLMKKIENRFFELKSLNDYQITQIIKEPPQVNSIFTVPGSNSSIINVQPNDYGSIIAFALQSNLYLKAMIQYNFLDLKSKFEAQLNEKEVILSNKDDIFNHEMPPYTLENEMICGKIIRLCFSMQFSNWSDNNSIEMKSKFKGSERELYNDQMFTSHKKIRSKRGKNDNESKMQTKFQNLNLQSQILKDFPLQPLEVQDNLLFEMIKNLQYKVYNKINQQFFENNETEIINIMISPDQVPQNIVIGGIGGGVTNFQNLTKNNQIHPGSGGLRRTEIINQNLFGIRKPASIFQDQDYKQRIMIDEMILQGLQNKNPQNFEDFTKIDYKVKIYYPKKFEALRAYYCGSQLNFIQSMMSSEQWKTVTGGKTKSPFLQTFDKKFVMKCVQKKELKMFLEFAPQYFDYLCKSFFHQYPCTLAKIVGVYKIQIEKYIEKTMPSYHLHKIANELSNGAFGNENSPELFPQNINIIDPDDEAEYLQNCLHAYRINHKPKIEKQKIYIFVSENLNYGLTDEDEKDLLRYDLKGSTLNRFVMDKKEQSLVNSQIANHDLNDLIDATLYSQGRVYHDNNFIYKMGARPMPMRYTMHKILNVCVNNDTLCLAKSQIIDYSLLVIINKKTKKLRFGIIDYVQHYNLEKKFETQFKKIWKGNEPTIIDPEKYELRFKRAIKKYFISMFIQNEKE